MRLFSNLINALAGSASNSKTVANEVCSVAAPVASKARGRTVFLNSRESLTDSIEREIILLGSGGACKNEKPLVQQMKNGTQMTLNPDGSYVIRDDAGTIIRTCDVTKVKREFSRDADSGQLNVRRFGLWSKPNCGRLDEHGNLFWQNNEVLVEERLNGLHVQKNTVTGVVIQTHHKSQMEIVKLGNGEVWRRQVTRDKELFAMWTSGKLSFKSETLFNPERYHAESPNGLQLLMNVSRFEQSWSTGQRTREKYSFRNPVTSEKAVSVTLTLGTGCLVLKNVESMTTLFAEDQPTESVYQLKTAMDIKIDIPGAKTTLEQIARVRNFKGGGNIALCFESADGDEYIVFTGNKNNSPNRPVYQRPADDGYGLTEQPADLVLA
jgi:hypothetical protein